MEDKFLYSRKNHEEDSVINVNGVRVGENVCIIAGPCSVEEDENLMIEIGKKVKEAGADMFRAGAFKPRTSPYSFQGMGEEGLKILSKVREETGLPIVTEVMDTSDVQLVSSYADVIQIGARNMQNFALLKAVGKQDKPVLLKRGLAAKIDEFLMAAEYIMKEGNHKVILCERGIRTFNDYTRNTLDLSIVPALKQRTHLPIIVDPSHGTGVRELVLPMSNASVASGADGLMIEAHNNPDKAVSDGAQTVDIDLLSGIISSVKNIKEIL